MSRNQRLYIEDIYTAAKKIKDYSNNITYEEFISDTMRFDAVVRNIEIIGEAAKHLDEQTKTLHKNIPWREIIGMRNILIHAYFGIDPDIVWDVIKTKIDVLIESLSI